MGDLLQRFATRIVVGVVSTLLALGWYTLTGGDDYEVQNMDSMPAVVFGGGGGTLTFEIEVSHAAALYANFDDYSDEDSVGIEVQQTLDVGTHTFDVDLSDSTYTYVELKIPDAEPGSKLSWTVLLNGKQITHEEESLDAPLRSNEAFFLQLEIEELGMLIEWLEESDEG